MQNRLNLAIYNIFGMRAVHRSSLEQKDYLITELSAMIDNICDEAYGRRQLSNKRIDEYRAEKNLLIGNKADSVD